MYNVIARNKKTGEIILCDLPKNIEAEKELKNASKEEKEKKGSRLEYVDRVLFQYKNVDAFLNDVLGEAETADYDVYIEYNTTGGPKTLDAYFDKSPADEIFRKKLINNILEKGITNKNFINFLQNEHRDLYKVYDHYDRTNCFQYNNLKRYIDNIQMGNDEGNERIFESISNKLNNNYLELRKMADAAFRFNKPIRRINDKARKEVDYLSELKRCITTTRGQIQITDLDVFTSKNDIILEPTPELKIVKVDESFIKHVEKLLNDKQIFEAYLYLSEKDENFFKLINESSVPLILKDATNKYIKSIPDDDYESEFDVETQKCIIRKRLSTSKTLKTVVEIMNEYVKSLQNTKKM